MIIMVRNNVGRPISNNIRCKECGDILILGVNARETKRGSDRPRSKCTICENRSRYTRKNKTVKPKGYKKYEEPINKTGQRVEIIKCVEGSKPIIYNNEIVFMRSHTYIYENLSCDECGGDVNYNYLGEPICVDCGLIAEGINYDSNDYNIRGDIDMNTIEE